MGKCDAVTYQVLGHLKTMLVLAFGFFMLNNPASWRNICGILCALVGMMAYGYCENLDKQAEAGFSPMQRQFSPPSFDTVSIASSPPTLYDAAAPHFTPSCLLSRVVYISSQ